MFINLCMNQWYKIINKNTDILNIPFLFQLTLFHKYTIQRSRHNTLGESERIRLLVGEGYVCWERKQWRFFPKVFFLQCPQKTWSPNDIILKSKKFFTGQKKSTWMTSNKTPTSHISPTSRKVRTWPHRNYSLAHICFSLLCHNGLNIPFVKSPLQSNK